MMIMGRLIDAALYGNEMVDEHELRDNLSGEGNNPCDVVDPWKDIGKRIKRYDPYGTRSYALLQQMELEASRES